MHFKLYHIPQHCVMLHYNFNQLVGERFTPSPQALRGLGFGVSCEKPAPILLSLSEFS